MYIVPFEETVSGSGRSSIVELMPDNVEILKENIELNDLNNVTRRYLK
jgi:tRNA G37 N-methylase Trm5